MSGTKTRKRPGTGAQQVLPVGVKRTPGGWVKHDDNAREVSKCSDGQLNTDQVRILRALRNGKEMNRKDLSTLSGPGPACGKRWLASLRQLEEKKLIIITTKEDAAGHAARIHWHMISAAGRKTITTVEDRHRDRKRQARASYRGGQKNG